MKSSLLLVCLLSLAFADQWAVIVSGSKGYSNYRHQSDACHAYQLHKAHGIPEDHIILFSYNDVVNSPANVFPGQLFNQPGEDPQDVAAGCKVTYSAKLATADNYLSVLTGDVAGIKNRTGIEYPVVLKSTGKDTIFLSFFDHGSSYIICFPDRNLKADELMSAFTAMHKKQMYSKLVYYLEACESGSMFLTLPKTMNIYAVSAANATESSWGYYCEDTNTVKGKYLRTCLGDLFAITWMEDCDLNNQKETLQEQWKQIKKRVDLSEPQQFGDLKWLNQSVWDFIGNGKTGNLRSHTQIVDPRIKSVSKAIRSRDIYLEYLKQRVSTARNSIESQKYSELLKKEENYRRVTDNRFERLVKSLTPNVQMMSKLLKAPTIDVPDRSCYYKSLDIYEANCGKQGEYALSYYSTLLNLCEYTKGDIKLIETSIKDTCSAIQL